MEKILVIDDDVQLSKLIEEFLGTFNYEITLMHEPEPALKFLEKNKMDLVILDIMLPGIDGFQALRKIREDSQIPVIMLTARGEVTDRIVGLELGADDYLAKPFEPEELYLRIKNLLKLYDNINETELRIIFGNYIFDAKTNSLKVDNKELYLTEGENNLLLKLIESRNNILSREELSDREFKQIFTLNNKLIVQKDDRFNNINVIILNNRFGINNTIFIINTRISTK